MKLPLLSWFYDRIPGGWKTWGPGASREAGAFAVWDGTGWRAVSQREALSLSAVWACMHIRAETIGTLPIQLLDNANNVVMEHDLYGLLRASPNADMTGAEFWSATTANEDMYGNAFAIIDSYSNGKPFAVTPLPTGECQIDQSGDTWKLLYNGEKYSWDRVFHNKGFSMDGYMGLSRLSYGRQIMAGQLDANDSAQRTFANGLKAGGFFKLPAGKPMPTEEQMKTFYANMDRFSEPQNQAKWMTLPPGFEPVGGEAFRITSVDSEMLNSRYFGIEEICRLFGVPPPLIGQTNKASSWASSMENLNQFFNQYSLQPTLIRYEQRIAKQLMSPRDRNRLRVKFNVDGLLRSDPMKRIQMYKQALADGWRNINEVRGLENLPRIPGDAGDEYRVALNTGNIDDNNSGAAAAKPENTDEA